MPSNSDDLRRVPWRWHNFGHGPTLVTQGDPCELVLMAAETAGGASLISVNAQGIAYRLLPDHPIAVAIGLVPELIEITLALAANRVADGEDLQVEAARSLVKRLGGLEDRHGEVLPEWANSTSEEVIDAAA